MKRVDIFAREPHYAVHAKAIYDALPESIKGKFAKTSDELLSSLSEYVVVFSYGDLKVANLTHKKVIFGEHGVGMFYNIPHASYAGSRDGRENVVLKLSPNKTHAAKEIETLPDVPVKIIGVPAMDSWASHRDDFRLRRESTNIIPTIAVSFHWNCRVCPETMSAHKEFMSAIKNLSKKANVIGHGHPRIIEELADDYEDAGIPIYKDFQQVLSVADMYICDNSSTIYEFCFMRKPVVLLNAGAYRKGIEQEGNPRFWKHANVGPQVDKPEELENAVLDAWNNYEEYLPAMDSATDDIFTFTDGQCAMRAVKEIVNIL